MFDCHAHYDDSRFDEDRDTLLASLFASDVTGIVNSGVDEETSIKAKNLAEQYEKLYFSVAMYPEYAEQSDGFEKWLIPLLSHKKCVSLGETGLDYHSEGFNREAQIKLLRRQLEIADSFGKPVVIHDRDAHGDCLETIKAYGVRGMFHSFSGSAEMAEILVKLGWYVSFSGVVTFKNAVKTVKALEAVPLDRILTETDSPYLTPHPHRGERNDSGKIRFVLEKIAEIKNITYGEAERITTENARAFYGISK